MLKAVPESCTKYLKETVTHMSQFLVGGGPNTRPACEVAVNWKQNEKCHQ